ncbi:hypothetical protein C7955_12011 [Eubacterium limosum]|nr:hypothetical protein C7955_12011 [Eubacterium limosum]
MLILSLDRNTLLLQVFFMSVSFRTRYAKKAIAVF